MSISTITSKGQTTIPREIRKLLNLHPGDRLEFVVEADGRVYLEPTVTPIESLSGKFQRSPIQSVSMEEIDAAIAEEVVGSLGIEVNTDDCT